MRLIPSTDFTTRVSVVQSDVDAGIDALGLGVFDVCRYDQSTQIWRNTRLKVRKQPLHAL